MNFTIKTFGLNGNTVSAVVHYNVVGKPDGYQTQGQVLNVVSAPSLSGSVISNGSTAADYGNANDIPVGTVVGPSYAPTEEIVVPVDETASGAEPTQEPLPTEEPAPAAEAVSGVESATEPVVEPAPATEPAPTVSDSGQ